MTTKELAQSTLERWWLHPASFVEDEFHVTPDSWQREALEAFPSNSRLAMKACKGPGKTAVLAWLILNFLVTRPSPRIGAVSITGDNLSMNLWPELAKWLEVSEFCRNTFDWTATAVTHKQKPQKWWAKARSWPKKASGSEQQSDALAGLHADYAMWVLDEGGGIPVSMLVSAEAVFASGIETKIVMAGNPTHLSGALYRASVKDAHLWKVITITGDPDDPKRSSRISLDWARQQIESYGRDNPWVMVNVLGKFPPSDINSLLGIEEVLAAMERTMRPDVYDWSQKRLGVDVARFGDDRSVIFPRQGLASFKPVVLRVARTTDIAARLARAQDQWGQGDSELPLAFIDDTGHWGHGVIDNMLTAGRSALPVFFHGKALDPRFHNMRAEMWMKLAEWVKAGGMLPNIEELKDELTAPTYTFVNGKFLLEDKAQIKARIGRSPDLADALALTFAMPDMPARAMERLSRGRKRAKIDFDPYEPGRAETDFDPFATDNE